MLWGHTVGGMGGREGGGETFPLGEGRVRGRRSSKVFQRGLYAPLVNEGHSRIFKAGSMSIVSPVLKIVLLKREASFWAGNLSLGFPTQDLFSTLPRRVEGDVG